MAADSSDTPLLEDISFDDESFDGEKSSPAPDSSTADMRRAPLRSRPAVSHLWLPRSTRGCRSTILLGTLASLLLLSTYATFAPFLSQGKISLPVSVTSLFTGTPTEPSYRDPFQETLPKRADFGRRPASSWPAEELNEARRGVGKLMREYSKNWPGAGDFGYFKSRRYNNMALQRLHDCLAANPPTCGPMETEIVLGGSFHFPFGWEGRVSGEDIWAKQSLQAYESMNVTVIFAYNWLEVMDIYMALPNFIKVIFMEGSDIIKCETWGQPGYESGLSEEELAKGAKVTLVKVMDKQGTELDRIPVTDKAEARKVVNEQKALGHQVKIAGFPRQSEQRIPTSSAALDPTSDDYDPHGEWQCVKSDSFARGIPAWKMFAFHFWPTPKHMLGHMWTLAPENYAAYPTNTVGFNGTNGYQPWKNNFYLGYSIEDHCHEPVSPGEREHRAYILAKRMDYFRKPKYAYSDTAFDKIRRAHDIGIVAGMGNPNDKPTDPGIENFGQLPKSQFTVELGHSKALVGIGRPVLSPTPFEALCMGVPFINAVTGWNKNEPDNPKKWQYQHEGLGHIPPPYVYHVHHGNDTELEEAVVRAVDNPIGSYILPEMRTEAVVHRHRNLLAIDWRVVAATRVEAMKEETKPFKFSL